MVEYTSASVNSICTSSAVVIEQAHCCVSEGEPQGPVPLVALGQCYSGFAW